MKRSTFLNVCLVATIIFGVIVNHFNLKTQANLNKTHTDMVAELDAFITVKERHIELNDQYLNHLKSVMKFDLQRIQRDTERQERFAPPPQDRVIHWNGRDYVARVIGGKTITINPGDVVLPKAGDRLVEVEVLDIQPREVNPLTNSVP